MRYLKYAAFAAALIILQTSAVPFLSIRGIEPDLILCFLVYFCLKEGALAGSLAGFILGISLDVYSPQTLGAGAFAACLVGILCGQLDERNLKIDDRYKILLLFIAALLYQLTRAVLAFGLKISLSELLLPHMLPAALYTSLVGGLLLLFSLAKR